MRSFEEASSEASRTACCDEETSKAIEEKEDLEADIAKHSSRLATRVLPYSTSRYLHICQSWVHCQKGSCSLTPCVQTRDNSSRRPRRAWSRESLVCKRQSTPFVTTSVLLLSSNLLHPSFTSAQEAQDRRLLDFFRSLCVSFRSLAELFLAEDNAETGYQNSTHENKVTED